MDTFIYDENFKQELRQDLHPFGEVTFLESLAEPGMTALDIGANKGLSTVAIAKNVRPRGRVFAFEPVPEYHKNLETNLAGNNVDNVRTYQFALGGQNGRIDYYKNGGGSGIVPQEGAEKLSVEVVTLDHFADKEKLKTIDLISMDCEGSELMVMEGGKQILQSEPLKLFCEIHRSYLESLGQTLDDIVKWLEDHDFEVTPVFVDDLDKKVGYEECTHIFASHEQNDQDIDEEIKKLEKELSDLEARWPAHSTPPSMIQEREELEEKLEEAKHRKTSGNSP